MATPLQKKITREEFDLRLAKSTERMRQERYALETQNAELEDLIGRYSAVLERLEADTASTSGQRQV